MKGVGQAGMYQGETSTLLSRDEMRALNRKCEAYAL